MTQCRLDFNQHNSHSIKNRKLLQLYLVLITFTQVPVAAYWPELSVDKLPHTRPIIELNIDKPPHTKPSIELNTDKPPYTQSSIELLSKEKLDQYIYYLEKVDCSQAVNRNLLINRVDTLGFFDGLVMPALIEMDYMIVEGDMRNSAVLNEAIKVFNPELAKKLTQRFNFNQDEVKYNLIKEGSQHFNFQRSFGDEEINFGGGNRDFDRENYSDEIFQGQFNRVDIRGDGITNFGNRGGDEGGSVVIGRFNSIFGNPRLRDNAAAMSRGGECIAGCNGGSTMGGAIGVVLGGIVGGFSGITLGGAGALPGIKIGAEGGGILGGVVGCAAGCFFGPPEIDRGPKAGGDNGGGAIPEAGGDNGGGASPETGGNNGGGASPKTGGDNGGGASPKTGGNNGGGTSPKTGGDNGGGTSPKTGGDNGGGTSPKTGGDNDPEIDHDPKPGKKDERALSPSGNGIFTIKDDSNPVVDRRFFRRIIRNNAQSPDAPLINFQDDSSFNMNTGN